MGYIPNIWLELLDVHAPGFNKGNTGIASAAAASETTACDEKQKGQEGRLLFAAAAIVMGHAMTFGRRQSSSTWLPNQMRSNPACLYMFVWLAGTR